MKHLALLALFAAAAGPLVAADPPTIMTLRGAELVREDFAKDLPPMVGTPVGFASGFTGWRRNGSARAGVWQVEQGVFVGRENVGVNHPATASCGVQFQDAVIQCEVRIDDVPLDGRKARYLMVRTVDAKDYVCSVYLAPGVFRIQKDDNDHGGPDKMQSLAQWPLPLALGEWHTVLFEILGDEMCVTVDGHTLTGRHPLIASAAKHSIMFVAGNEGSVRNFRVWQAKPNPDWAKTRTALPPVPAAKP